MSEPVIFDQLFQGKTSGIHHSKYKTTLPSEFISAGNFYAMRRIGRLVGDL
jgi:hypothetical protein